MPRRSPPAGPSRYSGRRVLIAIFVGILLGLAIALFLRTTIANTPVEVVSENFRWLYMVAGGSGALAGFTIESMRQLQQSSPDPAYHQKNLGTFRSRRMSTPNHTRSNQNRSDL